MMPDTFHSAIRNKRLSTQKETLSSLWIQSQKERKRARREEVRDECEWFRSLILESDPFDVLALLETKDLFFWDVPL